MSRVRRTAATSMTTTDVSSGAEDDQLFELAACSCFADEIIKPPSSSSKHGVHSRHGFVELLDYELCSHPLHQRAPDDKVGGVRVTEQPTIGWVRILGNPNFAHTHGCAIRSLDAGKGNIAAEPDSHCATCRVLGEGRV